MNLDLLTDVALNSRHNRIEASTVNQRKKDPMLDTESMRRLTALKQRIAEELLAEKRLREIEKEKPRLDPLSLAPSNEAKKQRINTPLDNSFHALVQGLKLDSWVQKELETELDRKSQEMDALTAQNERLREIITLRQEANQRRERELQDELDRVRSVTRRAAPPDLTCAMDELREMKELVNAGADTLYQTLIERKLVEQKALERTFHVRIREVLHKIDLQREQNTSGAQEWIDRYAQLEQEYEITSGEAQTLQNQVETLSGEVSEFTTTTRDGKQQFDHFIDELSSLKADNLRLEDHCHRVRSQIEELRKKHDQQQQQQQQNSGSSSNVTTPANSRPSSANLHLFRSSSSSNALGAKTAIAGRKSISPTNSNARPPSAPFLKKHLEKQQKLQEQQRAGGGGGVENKPPRVPQVTSEEKAAIAIRRLKATLEEMKSRIKQVRAAHIEQLQERTELELFLRQCVDDVRKDLARASSSDFHHRFTPEEKARVVDLLSAKLRVVTALHKRTFPNKLSPAMDAGFPVDAVMFSNDDAVQIPSNRNSTVDSSVRRNENMAVVAVGASTGKARNTSPSEAMPLATATSSASRRRPPRYSAGRSKKNRQQQPQIYRQQEEEEEDNGGEDGEEDQQDQLMDSLWSQWQDWSNKISASPAKGVGGRRR